MLSGCKCVWREGTVGAVECEWAIMKALAVLSKIATVKMAKAVWF